MTQRITLSIIGSFLFASTTFALSPPAPFCGDLLCGIGEQTTCPADCAFTDDSVCGDRICTEQEKEFVICPSCLIGTPPEQCRCITKCEIDCSPYLNPVCGDKICALTIETAQDCPADCNVDPCATVDCAAGFECKEGACVQTEQCKPYICADGTQHPRCGPDGSVISYFVDPCFNQQSNQQCAIYRRGTTQKEVCATCGNDVCEPYERCTSSTCSADGTCTEDCGPLYCDEDCETPAVPVDPCATIDCAEGYRCEEGRCLLEEEPVYCTSDAKQCPDGSYVDRDPENGCAFKPCPAACRPIYSHCSCSTECRFVKPNEPMVDCRRFCPAVLDEGPVECGVVDGECVITKSYNGEQAVYTDLTPGTELNNAAINLSIAGIVKGNPDGTFRPSNPVNRAEIAAMLVRPIDPDDLHNHQVFQFSDVTSDVWYFHELGHAVELGVIKGNPDGTFRAADSVNTAEFLAMVQRKFNLPTNLPYGYFDVPADAWYAPFAGIAEEYKLFPERGSFSLQPEKTLTREEVVIALNRLQ